MPGKLNQPWRVYLVGGCVLAAACFGIWTQLTMTNHPIVVSGKVSDPRGQPVIQARVYFTDGPAPLPDIAALTNAQGNFSFAVPKSGTYQLGCAADGFANTTVTITVTNGKNSPIAITVKP